MLLFKKLVGESKLFAQILKTTTFFLYFSFYFDPVIFNPPLS